MSRGPALEGVRKAARRAVRRGVKGLDGQTRELALALLTRGGSDPTVLPGPPDGPVLVVAPHPDDEAIGPGATLVRHAARGDDITVLVLTSGGATAGGGRDVTTVREEETRRALRHLGVRKPPVFGHLDDGSLQSCMPAIADLIGQNGAEARTVYVPSLLDPHPDHAAAARALAGTALDDTVMVMGYEVWSAGPVDALVDVTEVFAAKQAALAEYRVALQTVDYVRSCSGLAAYRSAAGSLGGRGFAEGFITATLGEYRTLI